MTWEECMEALGTSDIEESTKHKPDSPSYMERDFSPLKELLRRLGNPERSLRCIHVAGSNGKGSICISLQNILSLASYKTGLYISPHLERVNERFTIDGKEIEDEKLLTYAKRIHEELHFMENKPNDFDLLTALAFLYFNEEKVDFLILEVGLGGRLDSTNVIEDKLLAIIAHIGLEHTALLGKSLEKIAGEKAGIIAKNRPVVALRQEKSVLEVIRKVAKEKEAKLILTDSRHLHSSPFFLENGYQYFSYRERNDYALSLLGDFQLDNAMVICDAVDCLKAQGYKISEEAVKLGLYSVEWKGRFEILSKNPLIVLDGAHNPQAVTALVRSIEMLFPGYKKRVFFSVMADKNYMEMLRILKNNSLSFTFFRVDDERGLNVSTLKSQWEKEYDGEIFIPESAEAGLDWNFERLKNGDGNTLLLCLGSLYQVSGIRNYFKNVLA